MTAGPATSSTLTERFKIPAAYVRPLRLATFTLAVTALAIYALACLPRLYFLLSTLPEPHPPLSEAGLIVVVLTEYAVIVIGTILGFFLFSRRPDDVVTQLTLLGLIICFGNTTGLLFFPALFHPVLKIPGAFFFLAITPITYGWLLTFPDGRLLAYRFLWMMVPSVLWDVLRLFTVYPMDLVGLRETAVLRAAGGAIAVVLLLPGLMAQINRYRYHATPAQRQQTKWLLLGLTVVMVGVITASVLRAVVRQTGDPTLALIAEIVASVLSCAALTGGMLTLVFAVLRRGLWEIDVTLNRSLVAAVVTGFLGVVFIVIFLIVQAVLRVLAAGQGEIAVAAAALAVGLLFNPVRMRVRRFVDRRLYGLRFDLDQLQRGQQAAILQNPGALTGQIIGDCQLLGVLGRGAMGEVYRGHDRNGKPVAVKILRKELVEDTQTRLRFEREGAVAINHPGIVKTYKFGETGGIYFIVMEFVEGQTLRQVLNERHRLNIDAVIPFILRFAEAIDTAHAQGYVHRDIKPGNIMLRTPAGANPAAYPLPATDDTGTATATGATRIEAVLMDFGIAKIVDGTTSLTGSNAVGTIDYMAPEQITTSHAVDFHADIYALGVVMYEALTGERPFKGGAAQVMFGHLQQPPPDPREIQGDIPDNVALAIMRAMSKNPDDRFGSAAAFATALL